MTLSPDSLLSALVALLAVGAASYAGLHGYYRQREYELVQRRYLEKGVDELATQLETALNITSHNFARTSMLLKLFRDSGEHFDCDELRNGFLPYESNRFSQTANHRVEVLTDSKVIWKCFQTALAHATSTNSFYCLEVTQTIRIKLTSKMLDNKPHEEIANELLEIVRKEHEAGFHYAALLAELHYLGRLVEVERMNFKAVSAFSQRREVRAMLFRLEEVFHEAEPPTIAA